MINIIYYYVDLENVGMQGLKSCERLDKNDVLIIFYSKNAVNISIEILSKIQKTKATVKYIYVPIDKNNAAKNAMDFYLIATLYSNYRNKKRTVFIISKDKGFDYAIECGKTLGYTNVIRKDNIEAAKNYSNTTDDNSNSSGCTDETKQQSSAVVPSDDVPESTKISIEQRKKLFNKEIEKILMKNLTSIEIKKYQNVIICCLKKSNGDRPKNMFYNNLTSQLGKKKGLKIYNSIKTQFDDLFNCYKNFLKI